VPIVRPAYDARAPTGPILVVEDDPTIRDLVAEALRDEGYPVETASNGAEAVEVVEHERPSLVLLDMRMPVLDGWGFARVMRERGVRLPIVVMTAAEHAQYWCDEVGGDACLPKPFSIDALYDAVERLRARAT
jgi:two-component system, chemotaxis family, chemotaxis protein CheY